MDHDHDIYDQSVVPIDIQVIIDTIKGRGQSAILATSTMDADQLAAAHLALKALYQVTLETSRLVREGIVERMEDLGLREIQVGEHKRLYLGTEKDTVPRDNAEIMAALLEAGGPPAVSKCLASRPWKHGACKEPLGDQWPSLFDVVEKTVVKEGKPTRTRKLLEADDKFSK